MSLVYDLTFSHHNYYFCVWEMDFTNKIRLISRQRKLDIKYVLDLGKTHSKFSQHYKSINVTHT